MAKRIDSLQVASVNVTNQPPTGWGSNEENQENQQLEQVQYVHNQGSGSNELRSERTLVKDKETDKKLLGNDKRPTEEDEASSKDEAVLNKKELEKLKEKNDQPHDSRFNKETKDQHFPKFLEVFKKLEINIPLAEALEQMPLYAKFLKELINKKRSWHEKETIMLTEECSTVIQRGLPPKLKDPGSFFLPCTIGSLTIDKALYDLGASINLIPYSMMRRLCIEEVKPTQMSLELVDKSLVFPKGVIENLLVQVGTFIFSADFVILDLGEEGSYSIILERPFLTTTRAIIDVEQGELTLRVHDESITLNVFPEAQYIDDKENYMGVDKENLQWKEKTNKTLINFLSKQETSNKAGQKENEIVQNNEGKQEESEVLATKK
ncbi:uncharacterized protein LOC130949905 [Arachis stenosperma]|uniref:uncharacterized protein LOC130949905 n=1 Tax=Arachis stenosperma TaxID=217475 RepID=UPI0025AD46AE|nr:uncharacterized protein LOC130949905 [Arachis stenosperma]